MPTCCRHLWLRIFLRPGNRKGGCICCRRAERLSGAARSDSGDCGINANISREGTRIYHVPGGQSYAKTRIDTAKGERWFCSEAEARAAGWRPAKR